MADGLMEEIGKVKLDYARYGGQDLYCDGEVEDELLEIARWKSPAEYAQVIEARKSWPILYHMSSLRENIVDWIPMQPGAKVLEVGSGCGAVTGALARKAGSVTCVDLSRKRSLINAYRHRECGNITIHVGNFRDIEPVLPRDFDYICLIGVFEYGQGYIGGDTPYEDFLRMLLPHLAEGGRILIAIENKYGLKYFAGCKEDHLGTYFSGIENYPEGGGVRTFSRNRLERILEACGVEEYHFYYPYPDYKFMSKLYSDEYQPRKGELAENLRNFDRDRMVMFDEKSAFDGLVEDGLFPIFSNSYMLVVGEGFDIKYVKYSNERAPEYAIRTQIIGGRKMAGVRKYPMDAAAREHIRGMGAAYESLLERYRGGRLEINRCHIVEEGGSVYAHFDFVPGESLSVLMDRCLEKDDLDGFYRYVREYMERIGYNSEYPAADFDPIFSNILVEGDKWTLIDYEWTFGKPIDVRELLYRALDCYVREDGGREKCQPDRLLREFSVTREDMEGYRRQEEDFQSFVTGGKASLAELRERLCHRVLMPQEALEAFYDARREDAGGDTEEAEIYAFTLGGLGDGPARDGLRDAGGGSDSMEWILRNPGCGKAPKAEISYENFDFVRYADEYPDVKAAYGYDAEALYGHYVSSGIAEGRKGYASRLGFDHRRYADDYPDLKDIYGYDAEALYRHYITAGIKEKRVAYDTSNEVFRPRGGFPAAQGGI